VRGGIPPTLSLFRPAFSWQTQQKIKVLFLNELWRKTRWHTYTRTAQGAESIMGLLSSFAVLAGSI